VTPEDYRVYFGLRASTPLDAPALRAVKREHGAPLLRRYQAEARAAAQARTPAERRAAARGRPWRLEALLDPRNRQLWRERQRKGRERARELRRTDPAFAARVARRVSEAKGGRVPVACVVCGAVRAVIPAWVRRAPPACGSTGPA
jgi:hypothetical protein